MTQWTGQIAEDRGVIAMSGADARAVLQGVVTNDIDRLAPGTPLYAALLTPQGKYLFDFILVDPGDGRILFDVARDQGQALAQRLMMYCLRRDAKLAGTGAMQVALVWGGTGTPAHPKEAICIPDPRNAALGFRVYGEDLAKTLSFAPAPPETYDALRIQNTIPETGIELVPNEAFILEAGFERLNGVDFRKGCYVGQEVTARMKHKTELRKGLVQVAVTGTAPPGTPIIANGKPAGTLYSNADGRGLAHVRFDRAGKAMTAGEAIVTFDP